MKNLTKKNATRYTAVETDMSKLAQGVPTLAVTGSTLKPCKIGDAPGAHDPITYLIDDFMQEGTFNSIVGPAKSNKSFFALQMAFCVENGIPFLGYETHKHHTLIVDFELPANIMLERMENVKKYYNLPDGEEPAFLPIAEDFENGTLDMGTIMSTVTDAISKDSDLKLIIFDCFYKFCKGARNEEENVKSQLLPLKALASTYGICSVYITHTNKGSFGKDPTPQDVINAAGGSGVHGKIVDTTYVIIPIGSSGSHFEIATGGRRNCFGTIPVTKSKESYNFFYSRSETVQEVVLPNTALCQEIYDYIEATGFKNEKVIKQKFKVTSDDLRYMGFIVDTKVHKISYDKSKLALPSPEEEEFPADDFDDDEIEEAV